MKGRKSNINDAGISLLELIIAVSIFAIAAVIFLQAFVTTGRVNKKSAIYLNATTTAQNLMEELKAKKLASGMEYVLEMMESETIKECYVRREADRYVGNVH